MTSIKDGQLRGDLYQILQLSNDATSEQISQQYRRLLMVYHPDRGTTADPEKFKQIKLAHQILSNPEKRKQYDRSLAHTFLEISESYRTIQGTKRDLGYTPASKEQEEQFALLHREYEVPALPPVPPAPKYDHMDIALPNTQAQQYLTQNKVLFNQVFEQVKYEEIETNREPPSDQKISSSLETYSLSDYSSSDLYANATLNSCQVYHTPDQRQLIQIIQIKPEISSDHMTEDQINSELQKHVQDRARLLDLNPNEYQIKDEHDTGLKLDPK